MPECHRRSPERRCQASRRDSCWRAAAPPHPAAPPSAPSCWPARPRDRPWTGNTSTGWVTDASAAAVVRHIAGSVATDATGVRLTARSCTSGFLMSPPMDFIDLTTCLSTGASAISGVSPASDGFTTTTPLTRALRLRQSQRQAAAHRDPGHEDLRAPRRELGEGALGVRVPVGPARLGQVPPGPAVPGKQRRPDGQPGRGEVRRPGRTVLRLPVKPCRTRTPTGPPSAENGSASGDAGSGDIDDTLNRPTDFMGRGTMYLCSTG